MAERSTDGIREIVTQYESRIHAAARGDDVQLSVTFETFLAGVRCAVGVDISRDEASTFLLQCIVAQPVLESMFSSEPYWNCNALSGYVRDAVAAFSRCGDATWTDVIREYAESLQALDTVARQDALAEIYDRVVKLTMASMQSSAAVVYTPTPVVDYIIRSVEDILQRDFHTSISNGDVHVIDPFTGSGIFIARLMESGLVKKSDLPRKYSGELFANDVMLFAYYLASINLESAFHGLAVIGGYTPFDGLSLSDTFKVGESVPPMENMLFPNSVAPVKWHNAPGVRVIIGNPPWSATNNPEYKDIDGRIHRLYSKTSMSLHTSALYDPYVRAIRQASDWVSDNINGGIVAYVTNGGFITAKAFDGFRKALQKEFDSIYCFNLRGNHRVNGEVLRQEGGNVFGVGSRSSIAILILVKKSGGPDGTTLHYHDIGDYLSRDEKLDFLDNASLDDTNWDIIVPNVHGDWLNQRGTGYKSMRLMAAGKSDVIVNEQAPIFDIMSPAVNTARDVWCYNSSRDDLRRNIRNTIDYYNGQVSKFQRSNPYGSASHMLHLAQLSADHDPARFHWSRSNYQHMARGIRYTYNGEGFSVGMYRPFFKQHLYMSRELNSRASRMFDVFPKPGATNIGISASVRSHIIPFPVLMTDCIPNDHMTDRDVYFPRWRYIPAVDFMGAAVHDDIGMERVSNINPVALAEYRQLYGEDSISEDDLFYYVYGVMHSRQWWETFANDLAKERVRIPMASSSGDFHAFADAGRRLSELHVGYEKVQPYPLTEVLSDGANPSDEGFYRVERMRYPWLGDRRDRTKIRYNDSITLDGIPAQAQEYLVGSRSALDWMLDYYQIRRDSSSGIVNDSNKWAIEQGSPRYIIDLIKRVTMVSIRTMDIIRTLPELPLDRPV